MVASVDQQYKFLRGLGEFIGQAAVLLAEEYSVDVSDEGEASTLAFSRLGAMLVAACFVHPEWVNGAWAIMLTAGSYEELSRSADLLVRHCPLPLLVDER